MSAAATTATTNGAEIRGKRLLTAPKLYRLARRPVSAVCGALTGRESDLPACHRLDGGPARHRVLPGSPALDCARDGRRSVPEMRLVGYACRHPHPPLRAAFLPLTELTVLLGPNDSGKSTLLRAIERDLDGGHFDEVDEERAKLIGGFFYAEVSENELGAISNNAARTREEHTSEYGPRTRGRRPPWDEGLWSPTRYETPRPISPPEWVARLHEESSSRGPMLDALGGSRIVAFECAGRNQAGYRVWNAYWCLPPLDAMSAELRAAVLASDLPFIARKRDGVPPFRVGFYVAVHGNASHLHLPAAPLPAVSFGPYVDPPMPIGLAAPADFTAVHAAVDAAITRLVDTLRHCRRDVTLDGDPLPLAELRERESPRGWVELEDGGVRILSATSAAVEFISVSATRLLPAFISGDYSIEIFLNELDEWLQGPPFEIRLSSRVEGIADRRFPVERAADGHRLWIQLAILDALEQVGTVESLVWSAPARHMRPNESSRRSIRET